ncbi:hypothetical protein [Paenibacillus qinlingensis]|uniref:hypothetical protein n=1 Tax=Paenibacillus qinlingensis TaxID=1837343 RepID=UPI001564F08B|nr:hypothetical protein [Paenibacillus qinlingensis]NQX59869.1 hypothetical protein [Paenibacillus qinlingensis]
MNISINLNHERTPGKLEIPTTNKPSDHHKTTDKHKRDHNNDNITISPQAQNLFSKNGWKKSILESLMEHKQNIMDRRNDYLSSGLEGGASPEEMKIGLEQIDKQIQDIDKQIQQLQQDELLKATGLGDKNLKEHNANVDKSVKNIDSSNSQYTSTMQLTSDTMKTLISSTSEVKQVKSVKMAQLTLESESLNWASDPARSERLKRKALDLDGKMIDTSQKVVRNLEHTIKHSNEDIQQQLPVNEDSNIAQPIAANGVELTTEDDIKKYV